MQPEVKKYLKDILTSIEHISSFTSGVSSLKDYASNMLLKRGVERELEIIGEVLNKAFTIDPELPISNARRIINTRNRIIHGYDDVDDAIIWAVVLKHLPILKTEVEILMK
jgi:uncharacterized protein with HEPN domain